jgi:hypothetical protein
MPTPQDHILDGPEATVADTAALIHQHKENLASQLQESEDGSQDDFRNIPPCLVDLSIHSFLEGLDKRETAEPHSNAKPTWDELHPSFQRLRSLVQATFDADSDLCHPKQRDNAGLVISHYITEHSQGYVCCNLRHEMNTDIFRPCLLEPPSKGSRQQYYRIETKMLLAVMTSGGKAGPIQLSTQQQDAAVELSKGIENDISDIHCTQLLRDLLLSLYAPDDSSMHATNIFSSPVVAFLALICKTEQGAYHEISKIGQNAAMIQTCIRLHCLGHLMGNLQGAVVGGINDNWIMYVTPSAFICYADL